MNGQTASVPALYHQNIAMQDENTSHRKLADRVSANAVVLDVGCACGDMGVYLKQSRQCSMSGIEYSEERLTIARQTGAYELLIQADLNTFTPLGHFPPDSFDFIIFGDILEHLYSPEAVLRGFLPLLKKNGHILISLPNITHASVITQLLLNKFEYIDDGIFDRTHIRFFASGNINFLLSKNNLEVIHCDHVTYDLGGFKGEYFQQISLTTARHISKLGYTAIFQYVIDAKQTKSAYNKLINYNFRQIETLSEKTSASIRAIQNKYTLPKLLWMKLKYIIKKHIKGSL